MFYDCFKRCFVLVIFTLGCIYMCSCTCVQLGCRSSGTLRSFVWHRASYWLGSSPRRLGRLCSDLHGSFCPSLPSLYPCDDLCTKPSLAYYVGSGNWTRWGNCLWGKCLVTEPSPQPYMTPSGIICPEIDEYSPSSFFLFLTWNTRAYRSLNVYIPPCIHWNSTFGQCFEVGHLGGDHVARVGPSQMGLVPFIEEVQESPLL